MSETSPFECPRCGAAADQDFYGPCPGCRTELRERMAREQRAVEVAEYQPKVNVTPNAVALRED